MVARFEPFVERNGARVEVTGDGFFMPSWGNVRDILCPLSDPLLRRHSPAPLLGGNWTFRRFYQLLCHRKSVWLFFQEQPL